MLPLVTTTCFWKGEFIAWKQRTAAFIPFKLIHSFQTVAGLSSTLNGRLRWKRNILDSAGSERNQKADKMWLCCCQQGFSAAVSPTWGAAITCTHAASTKWVLYCLNCLSEKGGGRDRWIRDHSRIIKFHSMFLPLFPPPFKNPFSIVVMLNYENKEKKKRFRSQAVGR